MDDAGEDWTVSGSALLVVVSVRADASLDEDRRVGGPPSRGGGESGITEAKAGALVNAAMSARTRY